MIDGVAVRVIAIGLSWKCRQHRRTRNRQRLPRHVSGHAFEPTAEARGTRWLLVEGVEDRPLTRVLRPGFEDAAATDRRHRDAVGEVDRARVALVDLRSLHAGLRVD